MNSPQPLNVQSAGETKDELDFVDFLIILAKNKKLIFGMPVVFAILGTAISFALPSEFKATTKMLPPQQAQSSTAALLSQLGGLAGAASSAAGLKNPGDLYVGMLRSRTIADKLIAKFDLKKVYEVDLQEKARKLLEANTIVMAGKEGLITVEVIDENKKLVAPLANAYVTELIQLTKILAVTEAGQRRLFYERELEHAKDNLARAESSLKRGLDKRGVISVEMESRSIIETVSRLRAQASLKEIQLNSMKAFVTDNNAEYKRAQQELSSLRSELNKLENGRPGALNPVETPATFENIKLLRDVKYYQLLYELLAKQYEGARLDEAKDPSIIQILDSAVEPERKFRPFRALIVLMAAVFGIFVGTFTAIIREFHRRMLTSEQRRMQLAELKSSLSRKNEVTQ
jgi:uncharacterized protein involved in exopolysaccharide biosynthesis